MHMEGRLHLTERRSQRPEEGAKGELRGHERVREERRKAAFVPISLEYKDPASV